MNIKNIIIYRKRELIVAAIIIVCAFIGGNVYMLQSYDDFDVQFSVERNESTESHYLEFKKHMLRYNADGAFYTNESNDLIWNITYEMTKPTIDVCGDFLTIYDKGGTAVYIIKESGLVGHLEMSLPITEANIANKGTVAVLMQEHDSNFIELYDADGNTLVSGEIHTENSGYPIAIALSNDATRLMVALLNLNDGNVKTAINFYNFGNAGKNAVDNLVATYSYSDTVIPQIDFIENDKAIAFGDKQVIVFSSTSTPKVVEELYTNADIKSVFYNEKYFGLVTGSIDDEGEMTNVITLYNMHGHKRFSRTLDIAYNQISILSNDEILVTNGSETNIYTSRGIKKFEYVFDNNIYEAIPGEGARNYTFVLNGYTERVKLK